MRIRITPTVRLDGSVEVNVELVNVSDDLVVTGVVASERFLIGAEKQLLGYGYVACPKFDAAINQLCFFTDAEGLRHFHVKAAPGEVGAHG